MDELTRSAIASARDVRWELLDAMELLARSKDDFTVVCLVHRVGSLAMIGHCEIEDERGVKASKITCTYPSPSSHPLHPWCVLGVSLAPDKNDSARAALSKENSND